MRLTRRERWLVFGLGAFITAWALYVLAVRPAVERIETLNRVIPEKQKQLQELRVKSAGYLAMRARLDSLKKEAASMEKGFELLSFLESVTKEHDLAKNVATMKQQVLQLDSQCSETIVEVKLENVTLKQLIEFLLETKSPRRFLRIKSLYAQKNSTNPNLLDAVIQISALKFNPRT
ncbi:MAG TPA: type II secretion system protein GspM [Sedimentisphaerales bacterium]|nr:type II secretion system protein GspM [Sedimentisphaerales bacterium]